MKEIQRLKRTISLKRQAIPLIKSEIMELQVRVVLLWLERYFEREARGKFNPAISSKLDCVRYLLEG
jgi:hypothetical protein